METIRLDVQNFNDEVRKSDKTVLVDFYADWCGPCKMMSPVIDELAKELGEKVKVGKINVDENQDIAMEFGVMSIPTMIIFKNGKEFKRTIGVIEKSDIIDMLK